MKWKLCLMLLLISIPILLSSCATVQPWQKGDLADPIMIFDENPIDVGIREHYLDYREGSVGGTGAQSGGCGCG
ncbi:MAG: DUF4266 domain-containing protein [Calditrichaeota bacterium]|nr:MAG: DUF4266 domain-containing protein [Calditrichota bacterium]